MAHGFRYNVQIWTKDSGRGWCYAGNGKFLKTAGEVLSYGKEHADFTVLTCTRIFTPV